jgi:phage shock protein C
MNAPFASTTSDPMLHPTIELNRPMKLQRSSTHCMIAGVCGGLAEYLGWSAGRVRLIYVLVSILSAAFPGIIVYLVLWFLMPKAGR